MKHPKYKKNLFRNVKYKIKTEVAQLLITNKANNEITHSKYKKNLFRNVKYKITPKKEIS